GAAAAIEGMSVEQIQTLADGNRLRDLPGVGPKTERVIREALAGEEPAYLRELLKNAPAPGEGLEKGDPIRPPSRATATPTRTGPTAAARSTSWPAPPATSGTSTSCSPTTPPASRWHRACRRSGCASS